MAGHDLILDTRAEERQGLGGCTAFDLWEEKGLHGVMRQWQAQGGLTFCRGHNAWFMHIGVIISN